MQATLALRPDRAEVAAARRFARDTLMVWGRDEVEPTVVLLVSELVANAVEHAETEVVLTLRREDDLIRAEVEDRSPRLPVRRSAPPSSTRGRGVHLVASLADAWGVRPIPGDGKVVWFAVAA